MAKHDAVSISNKLLRAIFESAKSLYPRETVLLLRGKRKKNTVIVSDLVIPPLANYGRGFADLRLHMLPIDFSIVGTMHSHPSGHLGPSSTDLNHFLGLVLVIVGFPFKDHNDIAAYNRRGEKLALEVEEA